MANITKVEKENNSLTDRISAWWDEDMSNIVNENLEVEGALAAVGLDSIMYEIIEGHWGWGVVYTKLHNMLTEWAIENGGDYYDKVCPGVYAVYEA